MKNRCDKSDFLSKLLSLKGQAPVFLISALSYYKKKIGKNRHPSTKKKMSMNKSVLMVTKKVSCIFFKCCIISNLVLNYFPHNIQGKNILCKMGYHFFLALTFELSATSFRFFHPLTGGQRYKQIFFMFFDEKPLLIWFLKLRVSYTCRLKQHYLLFNACISFHQNKFLQVHLGLVFHIFCLF